jgi:hypothetical protein
MEREHTEEWLGLQGLALETLRASSHKDGIRCLQLLVMPSFEPAISYEIYKALSRRQLRGYFAVITRWRRDVDAEKFRTPIERLKYPRPLNPTFESKSFELTPEFVNGILDRFKAVSVPALTDMETLGLDGTIYEVGLGDSFHWSRFHWWEELPAEWQSLHTAFQDTLQELERVAAIS